MIRDRRNDGFILQLIVTCWIEVKCRVVRVKRWEASTLVGPRSIKLRAGHLEAIP